MTGIRLGCDIWPCRWVLLEKRLGGDGTEWLWPVKFDKKPADTGLSGHLATNDFREISCKDGLNEGLRGEDEAVSDLADGQKEGGNGGKASVLIVIG